MVSAVKEDRAETWSGLGRNTRVAVPLSHCPVPRYHPPGSHSWPELPMTSLSSTSLMPSFENQNQDFLRVNTSSIIRAAAKVCTHL